MGGKCSALLAGHLLNNELRRETCHATRGHVENIVTPSPQNEPYTELRMPKYVLTNDSRYASNRSESNP